MKVHIKRWNAVAAWRWDLADDDDLCGICRVQFDGTCPACKYPGDGCPLGVFASSMLFCSIVELGESNVTKTEIVKACSISCY